LSTRACVRSLLALDGGGGTRPEIIVVDDASDPPLQPFLAGLGVRLLRLDTNVGPGEGRNRGARLATGDVLAFIDNDCLADPGWLARLVPHFADPAVAIAGGRVTAPLPTGWLARYEAVRSPLDMGPRPGPVGPDAAIAYLPTCNFLVRRDAFIAVGGFTPAMRVGEDVDLCWRIIAAGGRATYDPSGRVVHRHRLRLAEMLARRADYGASEADLQQRHPAGRRLLPLPAAGLAGLAALTLATAGSIPGALGAAALALALVQLEIRVRRRRIGRLRPELPAGAVGRAVLRAHGAALYRLSGSIGRYYGLPLAVAVALVPALLPAALILWLLAPAVDHRRLAPGMPLAAYVGLHGLEMAAYQAGVWRGCLARRTLRPLLPALRLRR
jgi:mycofactocin system glycosyltransferase